MDIASEDSPLQLRMVLSPGATPAARMLVQRRLDGMSTKHRNAIKQIEISPQVGRGQGGLLGCWAGQQSTADVCQPCSGAWCVCSQRTSKTSESTELCIPQKCYSFICRTHCRR